MKGIKNSLKKLSFPRISLRESTLSSVEGVEDNEALSTDYEAKRRDYQKRIAKIVSYRNFEFPEDAVHPRILDELEDLEIREDDIFLLSFPASNGHLLEDLVRLLVSKNEEKKNTDGDDSEKPATISVGRLEVSNLYGHLRWLQSLKSPRILASHLAYDLLPRQLHTPIAKIIYLARNPKDHIIAYYYHHRLKGIQISIDDFIDLYLNGYLLYGSYLDHAVAFWELAKLHPSHTLFLSYEELKIVPFQMARLIADFLNLDLTDDELNEILAQKDAKSSQYKEGSGEMNRKPLKQVNKLQGVLGDWASYFNSEQTRKLDEMIRIKFESQQLHLTDNVSEAAHRINEFGRLMEPSTIADGKSQSTIMNGGSSDSERSRTASLQKKPIFTKDEAAFIRRKDKVVILEEWYQPENGAQREGNWWEALFCCGYGNKKRDYTSF